MLIWHWPTFAAEAMDLSWDTRMPTSNYLGCNNRPSCLRRPASCKVSCNAPQRQPRYDPNQREQHWQLQIARRRAPLRQPCRAAQSDPLAAGDPRQIIAGLPTQGDMVVRGEGRDEYAGAQVAERPEPPKGSDLDYLAVREHHAVPPRPMCPRPFPLSPAPHWCFATGHYIRRTSTRR